MTSLVSGFMERMHEEVDPRYKAQKEEGKKILLGAKIANLTTLVTSVALAILGISLVATGGLFGIPILVVGVGLAMLSYNAYKLSDNMSDVLDNPKNYQAFGGFIPVWDKEMLKSKLKQGTFGCNLLINEAVNRIDVAAVY